MGRVESPLFMEGLKVQDNLGGRGWKNRRHLGSSFSNPVGRLPAGCGGAVGLLWGAMCSGLTWLYCTHEVQVTSGLSLLFPDRPTPVWGRRWHSWGEQKQLVFVMREEVALMGRRWAETADICAVIYFLRLWYCAYLCLSGKSRVQWSIKAGVSLKRISCYLNLNCALQCSS